MNFCPMWAAGSTTQLAKFPVLNGIECLTILADNDENEASVNAASSAYWRWKDAGRRSPYPTAERTGRSQRHHHGGPGERICSTRLHQRSIPTKSSAEAGGQGQSPPPGDAKKAAFKPTLYKWRDPSLIPPREFVYGRHYAGNISAATVAPGGIGKTSLTIVNVMAMVSGRQLSSATILFGPYASGTGTAKTRARKSSAVSPLPVSTT